MGDSCDDACPAGTLCDEDATEGVSDVCIDALVTDEPEAGLLALSRTGAIVGVAEAAIGRGILFAARDDKATEQQQPPAGCE